LDQLLSLLDVTVFWSVYSSCSHQLQSRNHSCTAYCRQCNKKINLQHYYEEHWHNELARER